jgi:hypothetical protein
MEVRIDPETKHFHITLTRQEWAQLPPPTTPLHALSIEEEAALRGFLRALDNAVDGAATEREGSPCAANPPRP